MAFGNNKQQGTVAKKPLVSEMAKSNKTGMICHLTESVIIAIAYVLELVKGARELPYVLLIILLALVPPILELVFYRKNKDSIIVKHLISYGFAIFYSVAMLTTNNKLTFVYVIPMIIAISVYNDFKYALKINIGVIALNVAQVVIFLSKGVYVFETDSASIEIQVIVMVVFAVFSVMTSKTLQTNSETKVLKIQEESDRIEKILNNTMDVSKKMVMDLSLMNDKIAVLKEAVERTSCAMAEVNEGSADTADAVQKQLFQTEGIQNRVEAVQAGAKSIIESMNQTRSAVATGNENVEILVNRVKDSVEAGKHVTNELESLDEYMQKMNSIVDIITEITTQTSLLALNASIEAARAGEAGKGFAVVASEISKMADETQNAAVKITNLIGNVSSAIGKVVEVSADMINMIEGQNEATAQTAKSFQIIEGNTDAIYTHSNQLAEIVNHLSEANKEIVDSVSTVSAITEQVSAHASDTLEISEQNSATVAEVAGLSNDLQKLAERLID